MDHEEAIRTQAVDRYLLGQLPAETRDQFEEHFFECDPCAEDVRTGLVLLDNAAAEFAPAPAIQPAAVKASWRDFFRFEWRQAAFVMPVLALIAVSALWVTDHARLRRQVDAADAPQVVTNETLDVTRGETPITVNRHERYLTLSFNIGTDQDTLPNYVVEISGNGVPPATAAAPRHAPGVSYELLLPTERYKPGRYAFTVRGGPGTDGRVVKQFTQELE